MVLKLGDIRVLKYLRQ